MLGIISSQICEFFTKLAHAVIWQFLKNAAPFFPLKIKSHISRDDIEYGQIIQCVIGKSVTQILCPAIENLCMSQFSLLLLLNI